MSKNGAIMENMRASTVEDHEQGPMKPVGKNGHTSPRRCLQSGEKKDVSFSSVTNFTNL